jgi:hypothetical protein
MQSLKTFAVGGTPAAFTDAVPGGGSSYVLPALAAVVGLTLLILIVFVIIRATRGHAARTLKGPVDLFAPKSPVILTRTDTSNHMKGSYTFAFYARFDAVPDMRTQIPLLTWPGVWNLQLNPAEEQLNLGFSQTKDENLFLNTDTVQVAGATLQRWNQYIIAMEGRSVDIYINGKLIQSAILDNVPPSSQSSVSIVPGNIMGQIAYVQLWARRLSVHEVQSNFADTSDSQGRPYLGPAMFAALTNITMPNLFCSGGKCAGSTATAPPSQVWEFPYA